MLVLEVKTMAGSLARLPEVSLDMTVAEIKSRKDWPLSGIPPARQLVLFDGRRLDNLLTLAANNVRTARDGARVCLSVAVAAKAVSARAVCRPRDVCGHFVSERACGAAPNRARTARGWTCRRSG